MKLVIVDLDGTLFDTKDVNYHAYKDAISPYGFDIDYKYYCEFCNGRHYLDFLPQLQHVIIRFFLQCILPKKQHIKNIWIMLF